ncbi:hypothetical protein B0T10DRAFT_467898 [Thelonectria olida]|uniref:DUF7025 domain-containing protein n=1 Tax=Thelonectria olida TaxID=1576542 RepID=A0A9P8VQ08_9HYPO|nr:hypothetical protein B0T10DRAFT_467898 [Thelonectria olida]
MVTASLVRSHERAIAVPQTSSISAEESNNVPVSLLITEDHVKNQLDKYEPATVLVSAADEEQQQHEPDHEPRGPFEDVRAGHEYIQDHEMRMPLDWRIRRARHLSFTLQAFFRLVEDRLEALEDGDMNHHLRRRTSPRRPPLSTEHGSGGTNIHWTYSIGPIPRPRTNLQQPHPRLRARVISSLLSLIDDANKNDLLDKYGTYQAYQEELGCLIEFMDSDLKLLGSLKTSSVTKIAFSDLWHIFQPGVEVITAQRPINAYRVPHVSGGRPYLSPPEDKNDNENEGGKFISSYQTPNKSSDFIVTCYQISFDGNKFGSVTQSFSIQGYDNL